MKKLKIALVLAGVVIWLVFGYATAGMGSAFYIYYFDSTPENTVTTSGEDCEGNTIQVALLLDTSSSMSGLIEQAKSQLWNILNELARTEKEGEGIQLEIALYEYGNPSKSQNPNQINRLTSFTSDMDLISEKLFALNTSGGDEYCGAVIQTSLNELEWTNDNGLKVIYIAGNEAFTQGMVSYKSACKNAKEKGITINTIFCGSYGTGQFKLWEKGAIAGGGDYLNIDHNKVTAYISTPYDDDINDLNSRLNKTYIPYGKQGKVKVQNQFDQDLNARQYASSNIADRAVFKSTKAYSNTSWDLVDAYKKDKSVLNNANVVVDSLQNISVEELEARILEVSEQRSEIQSEIQELDKKRRQYKIENTSVNDDKSLQQNMIKSIQKQAKRKGYKVKE